MTLTARLIENRTGPLWVWAEPKPDGQYAIGVDASAGILGGDPCVAQVIDMETLEQVAEWYGWQSPWVFGRTVAMLGWRYNTAEVGVETFPSAHGIACYDAVVTAGYPNLFAQQVWEVRERRYTTRKGWVTSEQGKAVLMSRISEALADRAPIHSERLLNEMANAQLDERDRVARNCRNDLLMAYGIALKIADQARRTRQMAPKEPEPVDFEGRWWRQFEERTGGKPMGKSKFTHWSEA